ncbi:transporter [Pararhizobium gei]|uniref:transporter n=1 Tax=Pararhizobium gei TaxID=1395951 RepID=UPI0023DB969F|nr:transporter [Rhizobium gei]
MEGSQPIRFLVILSTEEGGDVSAGAVTLGRIAPVYYLFKDGGAEVVLATVAGGHPSLPDLRDAEPQDGGVRRFLLDRAARDDLADTLSAGQIVHDDFDAALCLGYSGTLWGDERDDVAAILASLLGDGKPVAVISANTVSVAPHPAHDGLLIFGETGEAPVLAAHALLAIVKERRDRVV